MPWTMFRTIIVQIVRDRLEVLLPEPLEDVQEREKQQREALKDYLEDFE